MNAFIFIYATMMVGYFVGVYFRSRIPSFSYALFLVLMFVAFSGYGFILEVLKINKFNSLLTDTMMDNYLLMTLNLIFSFMFGCVVSCLCLARIQYLGVNKIIKNVLLVPGLNLATIFFRLPKDTVPKFGVSKLNVTSLLVVIAGLLIAKPEVQRISYSAEVEYTEKLSEIFADKISENIKINRGIPYSYDSDGYVFVTNIMSERATVIFELQVEMPFSIDWERTEIDAWLNEQLCFQHNTLNSQGNSKGRVFVEFNVLNSAGQKKWQKRSSNAVCKNKTED
jgi:hypothetical protein